VRTIVGAIGVSAMVFLSSERLLLADCSRLKAVDLLSGEAHAFWQDVRCGQISALCVDEDSRTAYFVLQRAFSPLLFSIDISALLQGGGGGGGGGAV
jgi:hypothetical protein